MTPKRKPRRGKEPSVWVLEQRLAQLNDDDPWQPIRAETNADDAECFQLGMQWKFPADKFRVAEYVRRAPTPKRSKP